MFRKIRVVALLWLLPLVSFARDYPDLPARIGWLPVQELLARASFIVPARVTAIEPLGPGIQHDNLVIRLLRVHANVEYVVKGRATPESIVFYISIPTMNECCKMAASNAPGPQHGASSSCALTEECFAQ